MRVKKDQLMQLIRERLDSPATAQRPHRTTVPLIRQLAHARYLYQKRGVKWPIALSIASQVR